LCCIAEVLFRSLTKVDVTETAASDLAANAVLVPHAEVLHAVSDAVLEKCTAAWCTRGAVACRAVTWRHAPWSSCLWLTSDEDLRSGDVVMLGGRRCAQ
jgi:hypothetical protein